VVHVLDAALGEAEVTEVDLVKDHSLQHMTVLLIQLPYTIIQERGYLRTVYHINCGCYNIKWDLHR
jgi:hypothetical protein